MADRTPVLARLIDAAIEPFAPQTALRRRTLRMALDEVRQYDAAANGRRTQGWRRPNSSAAREVRQGLVGLRNGARELVRNDKYAASALRQITANLVGDGITATAIHEDAELTKRAQASWDDWCGSKVDGEVDFYGVQKLTARSCVEGGETVLVWGPDRKGPNGRIMGLEGDFLDHQKNHDGSAARIVQGVEYGPDGRAGYWLLPDHPGEGASTFRQARRFEAMHVDHVFERLRWGQPRGVSWFAPVIMDLRDVGDIEDAVRMRKKVEACLALILTPPDNAGAPGPFDALAAEGAPGSAGEGRAAGDKGFDSVRPGMVMRARPGETATTLTPPTSGDTVQFVRQQLMGVSANLAPYHLVTGDVSQANYSSLRACLLGFWANLDDWQQNMLVPDLLAPAFARHMLRLAMLTGDNRYLAVRASWAMPVRRFVDPLKDVTAEGVEIRMGLKSEDKALAERGLNPTAHREELARINAERDRLGIVVDTDPRRVTESGVLQAAVGYIRPKGD